jgi:hypothetical protein
MTTCYYLSPTRQATGTVCDDDALLQQGYQRVSFLRWLFWTLVHRGGDIDDTQKT